MNNILDLIKTPKDVNNDIVKRMRARRKEQRMELTYHWEGDVLIQD